MQRVLAFLLLLFTLTLYPFLFALIKLTSSGSFIFTQKRMGKNIKPFTIYKFRTMVENAELLQVKYTKLNEADGPVFKIRNDPRYTKVGKLLARLAVDELPQLINIIKGDMAFVGPRPLPINEAGKIPKKYSARFSVLPGLTSLWVVKGSHQLSFEKWMKLDIEYVNLQNPWYDIVIVVKTILLLVKSFSNLHA